MTRRKRYEELERGRRHEMEHVDEPSFAEIIAEDHLREDPHYYSRLEECMPEGCPTCGPAQPNPGFVRTKSDERLWRRAKEAAGQTYRVGSPSYWRVANFVFHKMKAAHGGRIRRNPSDSPRRMVLHGIVDDLSTEPRLIAQRDWQSLRRVAVDVGSEVHNAFLEFFVAPEEFDARDFDWLVAELHKQIDYALDGQIVEYLR